MNATPPLLSVLVLSYNHHAYIGECIRSIWEQDYPSVEIIVLDDGSLDNSYHVANQMIDSSPVKMRVIQQSNTGLPSLNFNRMAHEAEGDLLAFIAADDKFSAGAFKKLAYPFIQENAIQLVYSNGYRWINDNISELNLVHDSSAVALLQQQKPEVIFNFVKRNISPFYIQSCIVRKEVFIKFGGFDQELLADDWVFNIRLFEHLMKNKMRFSFVNYPSFFYRIHEDNLHKNFSKMIKLACQVSNKYVDSSYHKSYLVAKVFSNAIIHNLKEKHFISAFGYLFDRRNSFVLCLFIIAKRFLSKYLPV